MYNHIGLGGVLLIDVSTYVVSFLCYFAVRKGRHVVLRPEELRADILAAETQFQRFWREMREGLHFLRGHRAVILLGISWALFLGAMTMGVVVTPSLSERIFHAGAVGLRLAQRRMGHRRISQRSVRSRDHRQPRRPPLHCFFHGDYRRLRGMRSGLALADRRRINLRRDGLSTRRRWHRHEYSPDGIGPETSDGTSTKFLLFFGTFCNLVLALAVGAVAHKVSLVAAFAILACVYGLSFVAASWPVETGVAAEPVELSQSKKSECRSKNARSPPLPLTSTF